MNFNESGLNLIKSFEGCKLQAYQDQKGIWTIGFGCTHHVAQGLCISQDEADERLKEDIQSTVEIVRNYILPHQINDNQFSACVCLAFNIGVGNFRTSTCLNCIKMGNLNDAANAILAWNKVNGEVDPGLARRREAEKALFLS
jgi:lysozyme